MSKLLVKDKDLVMPGDIVAEGMDYLPTQGILREQERLIASQIGTVHIDNRLIKLIPLAGPYMPKVEDTVIGQVKNITMNGWLVDIGQSNLAMLSLRDGSNEFIQKGSDLSQYHKIGDKLVAKITQVTKQGMLDLTTKMPGIVKLHSGRLIDVTSSKIPRIIGKQGSMITMIKDNTTCKIIVGQNGKIWIKGESLEGENKAVQAINMIETETQSEGLTDKVEKFLGGKN